ncbi:DUF2335 domain-containing protein [Micromonospora coerulea]|uniref:DUF2335 domain-containing protein n=1 Tax=Micromonospora coerulea TaxID=47856 RepID=UPI003557F729
MPSQRPLVTPDIGRPGPLSLPKPADAQEWEAVQPGTFDRIMCECERDERHRRHMDLLELGSRVFGQVCGLGTVVILAWLAKYFVDQGAATQGAAIIGTGAVSIVAVFVTGKLSRNR